ncbi:hypothetical protein A1O1_02086 [Capronia coronata CBS 617.96]|uniref:Inner centromere protein ARK-binding domain-containing protein n=1 Tax=Capronia coronata CBS 617.96 TaxID=1182541 RepID=W9ZGQ6_9EURO|nr:uncharacterized protein A1O1_02086 [Capronia coronata CBS 617.96]EXJ93694.1 hypothetical protein A1O1_02086 [Capronia coronata CBS 617.96]
MTKVPTVLAAQLGTALLVAIGQKITKSQCLKIAYYMNVGYGRHLSVAEVQDILQDLNRDAARLVSRAVSNITEMTRDTLSLNVSATQATLMNDDDDANDTEPDDRPVSGKRKVLASSSRSTGKRRCDRKTPSDKASDDEARPPAFLETSVLRQPQISIEIPPKNGSQKAKPSVEESGIFDFLSSRESSPTLPSQRYLKMSGGLGASGARSPSHAPGEFDLINSSSTLCDDSPGSGRALNHGHHLTGEVETWEMSSTSSETRMSFFTLSQHAREEAAGMNDRFADKDNHGQTETEHRRSSPPVDAIDELFISQDVVDENRQMMFEHDDNMSSDGTNPDELENSEQAQSSPYPTRVSTSGRPGSKSVENAAAAAQLQSEAKSQRDSVRFENGNTPSLKQARQGSRFNPLEIKSESESEERSAKIRALQVNQQAARERRLKRKERERKQRKTISGKAADLEQRDRNKSTSPSLQAPSQSQAAAPAAPNRQQDSSSQRDADKPKHRKIKKEEGASSGKRRLPAETSAEHKVRIKKEKRERRYARKLNRTPERMGLESGSLSAPLRSPRTITAGTFPPCAQSHEPLQSSTPPLGKAQANAALRRDKEVRSSAPAPAFMTRNLGLSDHPSGCGDDFVVDLTYERSLGDEEEESVMPAECESTLTSPCSRQDFLTSNIRPHRAPQQGLMAGNNRPSPPRHSSNPFVSQKSANPGDVLDARVPPHAKGSTFNDRMIALHEQMSRQSEQQLRHQKRTEPQPVPRRPLTRKNIKQGGYRPVLGSFQRSAQVHQQLPIELLSQSSRWRRPSWARHSRSPSGESSYDLWGLFRMRTTWDDDENTIVDSDSELEIVNVPRPNRWRNLNAAPSQSKH